MLPAVATTSGRDSLYDGMDARDLVKKLDGLPLALVTAGAYLRHVAASFGDYLRLYTKSLRGFMQAPQTWDPIKTARSPLHGKSHTSK
ncbi:unnamed protein product [Clonostachys rosea f. rosea IK726]|uniref:Uncharacterized protein n=1 Tax=Clonostachys rosea f. rosea IK726 TaxID=1349383 RepID=A0ACA9UCI6_BIOOC|nr:unnamed protein product [Clonostachys rosea f. rosea IK726]